MNSDIRYKTPFQTFQERSGSAENKSQVRSQQQAKTQNRPTERQDISIQTGFDKNKMMDQKDLGMLSGREDASGGSGDHMEV